MVTFISIDREKYNRMIFSYEERYYFFKMHKFHQKIFCSNKIYHSDNLTVCPKCRENISSGSECTPFTNEYREVLVNLLESNELRLLQTTGELLHSPEYFLSDYIENHFEGVQKEILTLYLVENLSLYNIFKKTKKSASEIIEIFNDLAKKF